MTATFVGLPSFPAAASSSTKDARLRANLTHATHTIRAKRARAVAELDDWQQLRAAGKAVKDRTLRHLDRYLVQVEQAVTAAGGTVHWARDAAEANRIVAELVKRTGETEVVKVKSMATQEIGLNEALAAEGVRAYETDLAELIVQLADDRPSHILVPAIHRNRGEIRDIFTSAMARYGRPAPAGLSDRPAELAEAARLHLREKFLRAKVGVSGANFLVAETGTLVVLESEGNGRMCLTLPETLISVAGVEKIVPTWRDLEVFLQLLPRSSTAERMNPYTSTWTGVTPGDGPQDFHLVLLDNGRTDALADQVGRQALRCIRCSACLNVCPVYERAGGHAYGSAYPGPIGAILTPQLRGVQTELDASLPYASSLCGACYEVCPVAIDIPEVLVHLRAKVAHQAAGHRAERAAMKAARWFMLSPKRFAAAERAAAKTRALHPKHHAPGPGRAWSDSRDLPSVAAESFRDWWKRTQEPATQSAARGEGVARTVSPPERDSGPASAAAAAATAAPPAEAREGAGNGVAASAPSGPAGSARDEILARVRRALADVPSTEAAEAYPVPRDYREVHVAEDRAALTDLLARNLDDYRANVHRCSPDAVAATLAGLITARGSTSVAVPEGFAAGYLTQLAALPEVELVAAPPTPEPRRLDQIGSVVTGCALAIAETGTLVLDGGLGQGARALTLVPDHHVCVVRTADQLVASVARALPRLDPARPLTWISGPSATSDIELDRVEGVHGPRTLDVILVED